MDGKIKAEAHEQMGSKDGKLSSTTLRAAQKPRAEESFLEFASAWTVLVDMGTILN
jgi:hypothetical protein